MGILGDNPFVALGNPGTGYQIEQSLRFNSADSTKLSRSPSVAGNQRQFTISFWVKNTTTTIGNVFVQARTNLRLNTTNAAFILNAGYGGTNRFFTSNASLRDPSAWYHFVLAFDTTQATETDRVKIWVNNQLQTYSSASYPPQNQDLDFNTTEVFYIGAENTSEYLNGYLAEFYAIDGSVLAPTDFGEPDNNGVWRPKAFIPPADRAQFPATNVVYRDGWSASALNPYYSFDGLLWRGTAVNGVTNATWSGSIDTSGATTVRILTAFGANSGQVGGAGDLVKVNNTDISGKMKTANAYLTLTWIDITTEAGNAITGLYMNAISGVSNPSIAAIDIDGVVVVDELSGYGENGAYLTFNPGATNGIGHDHSGNGNNLSPTGFTTSGTGTDVMSDTPTNNFMTWNPIVPRSDQTYTWLGVLSEGNLKGTNSGVTYNAENFGTILLPSSGKYYWECAALANVSGEYRFGCVAASAKGSPDSNTGLVYRSSGVVYLNGSATTSESSWTTNDIISFAADIDGNTLKTYKNGTLEGTYTSFFQSGKQYSAYFFCDETVSSNKQWLLNAGQRDFEHTPPTGHVSVCTANLPAPDIADGSEYFNTVTYSGDNSSPRTVSTVGFQSDFVWVKNRTDTGPYHMLTDVVRGGGKTIFSNDAIAEVTNSAAGYISGFATNGFELTAGSSSNANVNATGKNYVAWNWLAGGSVSADNNTDGSITSTVSANPTAGFSIVSYTGTGANATVGHGLGVAPAMMIIKDRDAQTRWIVYHQTQGNAGYLRLDTTAGFNSDSTVFNSTSPSSTVFSVGTSINTNPNGNDVIAYCFAEVEGYSKFGSYTGNGSTDGPFVYCGFKPAFVLTKNTDATNVDDWSIEDATRDPYNLADASLRPNSDSAEDSAATIDILSNGFKIRTGDSHRINFSGELFIFAAFASSPFGGFRTTPATAR